MPKSVLALAYSWSDLPKGLGLVLVYAALGHLSLAGFSLDGFVSFAYFPIGLAFAVFLLGGWKFAPAIILGEIYISAVVGGASLSMSLASATNAMLEALLGCALLLRVTDFDSRRMSPRDFFALALVTLVTTALFALSGAGLLVLHAMLAPGQTFAGSALAWWQGDIAGIWLLTPMLLLWRQPPRGWLTGVRTLETLALFGLATVVGEITFVQIWIDVPVLTKHLYWPFLFLVWAAVRYGRQAVVVLLTLTFCQALFGAIHGRGHFAADLQQADLWPFWQYMAVMACVGVMLASAIKERDRKSTALSDSEERLRLIAATIDQVLWLVDSKLETLLYISPAYEKVWGRSCASLYAAPRSFLDAIDNRDRERVLTVLRSLKAGRPFELEYRIHRPDGSLVWIHERGFPAADSAGNRRCYIGVAQDISIRKQAEQNLVQAHERLQLATQAGGIGIWDWDIESDTLLWDDTLFALFGCHRNTFTSNYPAWLSRIHDHDRSRIDLLLKSALAGATIELPFHFRLHQAESESPFLQALAKIHRSADGTALRMTGVMWDVSVQKRHEIDLRQLNRRLDCCARTLQMLVKGRPLPQVLTTLIETMESEFSEARCSILTLSEDGKHLHIGAAPHLPECYHQTVEGLVIGLDSTPCTDVMATGTSIFIDNLQTDPRYPNCQALAAAMAACSGWLLPICNRNGRVLGCLSVFLNNARRPTAAELEVLREYGQLSEIAIEHHRLETAMANKNSENRELYAKLQNAREQERRHIARELHDALGQLLTTMRFEMNWLESNQHTADHRIIRRRFELNLLMEKTMATVRQLAEDLRPGMLDDLGLVPAFEHHIETFAERTGIAATLTCAHEEIAVSEALAVALFRLLQEALTNVTRHAQASSVAVELWLSEHAIHLSISDNGIGIGIAESEMRQRFGLRGMRERVNLLAGTFSLQTTAGGGVQIAISLPRSGAGLPTSFASNEPLEHSS